MARAATEQQARFKDASWFPKNNEKVLIGGAGGTGSWMTYFLTKICYRVFLYDFDILEEHNLGGQFYLRESIGDSKVKALSKVVSMFCPGEISTFCEAVTISTPHHYFIISAFDNMKARTDLYTIWKKSWAEASELGITPILIDGRLEMETFQIYCVTPVNAGEYEKTLFQDYLVEDAPCTMKQTSHIASMMASLMTAFFTNHMTNVYAKTVLSEVPFYYEYVVPMNLTITRVW
jgi:molybdopterin/thiamine biosynthesis adenylyltransferase